VGRRGRVPEAAELCSIADNLNAEATDPKTRLHPRHARQFGIPNEFPEHFRVFRRRGEVAAALL
jgi:hypothetical protein